MPVRQIRYQCMTITAAAIEVVGTGRFALSLSIAGARRQDECQDVTLVEPHSSDVSPDEVDEALDSMIDLACSIVDERSARAGPDHPDA